MHSPVSCVQSAQPPAACDVILTCRTRAARGTWPWAITFILHAKAFHSSRDQFFLLLCRVSIPYRSLADRAARGLVDVGYTTAVGVYEVCDRSRFVLLYITYCVGLRLRIGISLHDGRGTRPPRPCLAVVHVAVPRAICNNILFDHAGFLMRASRPPHPPRGAVAGFRLAHTPHRAICSRSYKPNKIYKPSLSLRASFTSTRLRDPCGTSQLP